VLEALIPDAIENDIGHVQLSDLDHAEGDGADEHKFDRLRIDPRKRVRSPTETRLMKGQKRISTRWKTLFLVMSQFL